MKQLLESNCIIGVDFIFGELLQGVKNSREKDIIHAYWKSVSRLSEPDIWLEAGDYSGKKGLIEKGVGLIDAAIIILALKNGPQVWTLDKKLKSVLEPGLLYR